MGGRKEGEDLEAATDFFDWVSDDYGEELDGYHVHRNRDESTPTGKAAGLENSTTDSSATTAASATKVARSEKSRGHCGGAGAKEEEAMGPEDPARERHKAAERERRKSMGELFLSLHALLPHGQSIRKEQSAILDEVIEYIPFAASRLRTLRGDYYHQHAARVLRTAVTPSASSGSTSSSSRRRNYNRLRWQHPYSSARSSSNSSTSYGSSSCDLFFSGGQSSYLPLPTSEKRYCHIVDDRRNAAATKAAVHSIINSSCASAAVANNHRPPQQLHNQLQQQQDEVPNTSFTVSFPTSAPSRSVSVRVRGDRVSISVIDTREPYTSCSSHGILILSALLDELEVHHLRLLRSTHCKDGTKLLHYSECKIEEMEGTPTELKANLQHLVHKLQRMRNTGNA